MRSCSVCTVDATEILHKSHISVCICAYMLVHLCSSHACVSCLQLSGDGADGC